MPRCSVLLVALLLAAAPRARAQEREAALITPRIGNNITPALREYFHLFPALPCFTAASAERAGDGGTLFRMTCHTNGFNRVVEMRISSSETRILGWMIEQYETLCESGNTAVAWRRAHPDEGDVPASSFAALANIISFEEQTPSCERSTITLRSDERIEGTLLALTKKHAVIWTGIGVYRYHATESVRVVPIDSISELRVSEKGLGPKGVLAGQMLWTSLLLRLAFGDRHADAPYAYSLAILPVGAGIGALVGSFFEKETALSGDQSAHSVARNLAALQRSCAFSASAPPELGLALAALGDTLRPARERFSDAGLSRGLVARPDTALHSPWSFAILSSNDVAAAPSQDVRSHAGLTIGYDALVSTFRNSDFALLCRPSAGGGLNFLQAELIGMLSYRRSVYLFGGLQFYDPFGIDETFEQGERGSQARSTTRVEYWKDDIRRMLFPVAGIGLESRVLYFEVAYHAAWKAPFFSTKTEWISYFPSNETVSSTKEGVYKLSGIQIRAGLRL